MNRLSRRHTAGVIRLLIVVVIIAVGSYKILEIEENKFDNSTIAIETVDSPAGEVLSTIEIKGRAPKTGYTREAFGGGWQRIDDCDMRNYILARDLVDTAFEAPGCKVASGVLHDPYSGKKIAFNRGPDTSDDVQIDHVVALGDAWQKGAQQLSPQQRVTFANDPLELLAVDGQLNQQKSDGDAATWLPPDKSYRCNYVARQIAVKKKYSLWMTRSEYDTIASILQTCPEQKLPTS
jgi:hypothetical protein